MAASRIHHSLPRQASPEAGKTSPTAKPWLFLAVLISLLGAALFARAQSYSIDWSQIAGGGGTSTGGVYSLSGTIGQHDAGNAMTGANYSLTGGFWALVSVVQTPGAPKLAIRHSANSLVVYWQDAPGWTLQQNNSLTAPASWTASSGITTVNGTNQLTVPTPAGDLFFRLDKP